MQHVEILERLAIAAEYRDAGTSRHRARVGIGQPFRLMLDPAVAP